MTRTDLDELLKLLDAQKKSWVISEFMLEYPDMTLEKVESLYDRIEEIDNE